MRPIVFFVAALAPLTLLAQHEHGHPADLGNVGTVHFATSCNAAAQMQIDRADALLHSFWYGESENEFRRAAQSDPECGMAWWGVAMSNLHQIWGPPSPAEFKTGSEAARKAKEIGAKTAGERAYIDAINAYYDDTLGHAARLDRYMRAMDGASAANPDDHEAAIFDALAIRSTVDDRDKTYAKQKKAGEILTRVLPLEPQHPGIAHYIIHCYDYPSLASLALPAARAYAKLAPGSPHALHMPSHIFTRLGLWDESIASNLASAEKARNYGLLSDELHAIDYLEYAYLQVGRNDKALELVQYVRNLNKLDAPTFQTAYALAAVPARYAVERREWKEAATLTVPSDPMWDAYPWAEANIDFAVALGAARSNQPQIAQKALDRLAAIRERLIDRNDRYWADQVEIQRLSAAAWLNSDLKMMQAAADLEASTDKHPVTPGAIVPARELLAEMLLDQGKLDEGRAEAQHALRDAPNRSNALRLARVTSR